MSRARLLSFASLGAAIMAMALACDPGLDGATQPGTTTTDAATDGDDAPADDGDGADHSNDDGGDDSPTPTSADDGPGDDMPDPDDDGTTTGTVDDGNDDGPLPSGCEGAAVAPGVQTNVAIEFGGTSRSYDLFIPTGYDPSTPAPLVLNFHGLLGSPSQQSALSQFNLVAEARDMVVAYPAGIGNSFNAGVCCGDAFSQGVDDVGFSRAVVLQLQSQLCIDPNRVYATGMSNGGHMAHLLACEAADVFAATASVTGVLNLPPATCDPGRPISVMDFHGDADPIVPFGGTGIGFPAVPQMMQDWAARNGCGGVSQVSFEQGDMRCETWPACTDGVETTLCVTAGGGHCWPGAGSCLFGNVSSELSASEAIATMFDSQSM